MYVGRCFGGVSRAVRCNMYGYMSSSSYTVSMRLGVGDARRSSGSSGRDATRGIVQVGPDGYKS